MKQILINRLLISVIFISILAFTFYYFKILIPFFIGAFIAYILNPFIDFFEKKKVNRGLGSLIILICFLGFLFIFSLSVLPIIIQQTLDFLERFPDLVKKLEGYFLKVSKILGDNIINFDHVNILKDFHNSLGLILKTIISKLFFSSLALLNLISLIIITPIVSWYFLKDWKKIKFFVISNIPKQYQNNVKNNFNDINIILSSYLRGQFLVSIILGIYYFIAFYIIGIEYSLFLGIFSGIFSLIPYFGILISFILSVYIAILQFTDIYYIFIIILIFLIAFLFEGYFLSPKIIGERLGLHPLAILYSVFIFGSLLGFMGIFFAIPFSSIIFLYYRKVLSNIKNTKR